MHLFTSHSTTEQAWKGIAKKIWGKNLSQSLRLEIQIMYYFYISFQVNIFSGLWD